MKMHSRLWTFVGHGATVCGIKRWPSSDATTVDDDVTCENCRRIIKKYWKAIEHQNAIHRAASL